MSKYAFVDRDGTMIIEPQHTFQVDSLDSLEILPGVIEALKKLSKDGYKLIMVSNQNGIGSPSYPQEDFDIPQNAMMQIFYGEGIIFDQVLVCPHFPSENCDCCKPKLGMLEHIKDIDRATSIMIGDRATDMELARNLGIKGIKLELNKGMKDLKI